MTGIGSPGAVSPALSPEVEGRLRLGLVRAEPVRIGPAGPDLTREIEEVTRSLAAAHAGRQPSDIEGLGPARDLYRAFGIDPTRTRPSSEALLRRLLAGKPFPAILNAVDVSNLCALRFLLPIGLYDASAIRGAVSLRRGTAGESYQGIRKDEVHLEGRPVLADAEGPFGNPTSDSLRTSVVAGTRSLLMVIFAPAAFPARAMAGHVRAAQDLMARHLCPPGETTATSGTVLPEA